MAKKKQTKQMVITGKVKHWKKPGGDTPHAVSLAEYRKAIAESKDPIFKRELTRIRKKQLVAVARRKAEIVARERFSPEQEIAIAKFEKKKEEKEAYKQKWKKIGGTLKKKISLASLRTSRKKTLQRATRARAIAGLLGAGEKRTGRPGRPRESYKYGMPIHIYKKLQARQKVLYSSYQDTEARQLSQRGLTPQMVQQLQLQRTVQQPRQLQPQQLQQEVMEEFPNKKQQMNEVMGKADDDLNFRRWMAQRTISPRTQEILLRLRKTQLKGPRDDLEMQRRLEERRMVADAGNLMKTPFIFKTHQLDVTRVPEDNILKAPNTFKEDPENFILKKRARNILDTGEDNTLKF